MKGRPRKILALWKEYLHIDSADFEALIQAAHYADMAEFLDAMRLGREGDVLLPGGNAGGSAGAVRLTTLHGSKGLEFPVVFLCGLTEKVLPLVSSQETDEEEERRLFYVALTRAKKKVFLVTVKDHESDFVTELQEKYGEELKRARWECPVCGGRLLKKAGPFGEFYGCSNYKTTGCRYKRPIRPKAKD